MSKPILGTKTRRGKKSAQLLLFFVAPFVVVLVVEQYWLSTSGTLLNDEYAITRLLASKWSEPAPDRPDDVPNRIQIMNQGTENEMRHDFADKRTDLRAQFQNMQTLLDNRLHVGRKKPQVLPAMADLEPTDQREDRIIYFLHIHKSAGSTMCVAARANGLKVADTNCNVQRDQRCCGSADTFEAQQQYAMMTPYAFVANERDMYEAMDTDHYRYAVTLRQSRDRYLSHWKNVVRWHYPKFQMPFTAWWQGQPDNWNLRKICGSRCENVPKYQITKSLFEYTLARLKLFEDILLFDRFNNSFVRFAHNVGWTKMPISKGNKRNVTYPSTEGDEWDPMMSVLDDALYEVAMSRYDNLTHHAFSSRTRTSLTSYFRSNKGKECTTPCCADTCTQY